MKKLSLCSVLLVTSMSLLGISEANAGYDYASSCPSSGGKMKVDKWSFYYCECTSYVADRLNERGIPFNNTYKLKPGVRWSNASNWSNAAKLAGISQDNSPKQGDVAWFSSGHVAYVEQVAGSMITISEYNWSTRYNYGTRTISATSVSKFIHF